MRFTRDGKELLELTTYVTLSQKAKIEARAQEKGLSVSALLRTLALRDSRL